MTLKRIRIRDVDGAVVLEVPSGIVELLAADGSVAEVSIVVIDSVRRFDSESDPEEMARYTKLFGTRVAKMHTIEQQ